MNYTNRLFILLMLYLAFFVPSLLSAEPPTKADSIKSIQTTKQILDKYTRALKAISKEIPHDTFETSAIIKKVGKDPQQLTAWVRDNTKLVPYQGLLRGAIGVLMDRYGNSLDRAVLLHTLLSDAGHTARLARGHLKSTETIALYNAILSGEYNKQVSQQQKDQETIEEIMTRYATKFGLDRNELMLNHHKLAQKSQRLMEDAKQRVAEQTKELLSLIGSSKNFGSDKEKQWKLEGLADHWWVQWQDKKGDWVDLDILKPLLEAKTTVHDNPTIMSIKEIPDNLVHKTNIRVVIETLESGKLSETTVLKQDVAPSKILESSVVSLTLTHVPSNMTDITELLQRKDKIAYLKSKLLKTEEWLPVLIIDKGIRGKEERIQNRFTIRGVFTKTSSADATKPVQAISNSLGNMGGFLSGLSSGIGGSQKEVVKEKSQKMITAEWIEYEIKVPGLESKRIRRQIFDLIGPHARSTKNISIFKLTNSHRLELGTALLGETRILSMANSVSPAYVASLTTDALLENLEKIKKLSKNQKLNNNSIPQLATMPGATYNLALVRDGWRKTQDTVYLDRPNIITTHQGLHIKSAGMVRFNAFDIVYNHLAINDPLAYNRFRLNLEQGVLDTNAEALVLHNLCQSSSSKDTCQSIDNTAEQFFSSLTQDEKWTIIHNKKDLNQIQASSDIQTRIDIALDEGNLVVFSGITEQSHIGHESSWWIIDSETGRTLGITSRGWGDSFIETIVETEQTFAVGLQGINTLALTVGCSLIATHIGTDTTAAITLCVIGGVLRGGGIYFSIMRTDGAIIAAVFDTLSIIIGSLGVLSGF